MMFTTVTTQPRSTFKSTSTAKSWEEGEEVRARLLFTNNNKITPGFTRHLYHPFVVRLGPPKRLVSLTFWTKS